MKTVVFFAFMFFSLVASSQPVIKVEVSSDTIAIGDIVEVVYTIENGDGKFAIPDMAGLPVISGPNTSSSFMYQNGKQSSNQSFSFRLRPTKEGRLMIPATTYATQADPIVIQAVEIVVYNGWDRGASPKVLTDTSSSKATREKKKF
jgi:hypothetical protein